MIVGLVTALIYYILVVEIDIEIRTVQPRTKGGTPGLPERWKRCTISANYNQNHIFHMTIRSIDLNLLPVLRAVLECRSVSGAARSLGMSQPAVSNALSRLRHHYDDPLFHRHGGRMEPTPRAIEIGFIIVDALARVESTLESSFDPRALRKTFSISLVSYSGFYFLPALIEKLRFEAPNVQVHPDHMDEATAYEALSSLDLDFAMGIFWEDEPTFSRIPLLDTSFKLIMRPGHPLANLQATAENVASYKHVRLPILDNVDRILDTHGLQREFGATSPNPLMVPFMVAQSDLIAILPSRLAMSFATVCPLHEVPLAFDLPNCNIELISHPKHTDEASFQWFADAIRALTLDIDRNMQPASSS